MQKSIEFEQSLCLDWIEKFKSCLIENRVDVYYTDQPATAILGKRL